VRVRYDTPNEKGVTRRERNAAAGFDDRSPTLRIPEFGEHLWELYQSLSESTVRVVEGICRPIPPETIDTYLKLSGTIIGPTDFRILQSMDKAFCETVNSELNDFRIREKERAEQEAKSKRR
jgi:hypothetical protein